MASLGAQLKLAREKRGVTLEDVSSSTKIGTRMLRAIEDEHFDQLPGGIFNKGFVRAYAKAVGLDEEKAISDYLAATEPAPLVSKNDEAPNRTMDSRVEAEPGEGGVSWGLLALLLILVALAFAGWGYYSREVRNSEAPAAQQEPVRSNLQSPAAAQSAQPNISPAVTQSGAKTVSVSNPAQSNVASSNPAPGTAKTELASSETPNAAGYFSVHVKVRQDSWMSISSDGKTVLQGTVLAPTVKAVKARNQIVVKAGNVGALDFEFNGEKLPAQGQSGEVKTLTFGADGLEAIQTVPVPASPNQQ